MVATGGLLAGGILLSSFQTPETAGAAGEVGAEAGAVIPAVLSTSHPVSELLADDLSFEEARDLAREEIGSHGLFTYKGVVNVTTTEMEMDQMTAAEKEAFMQDVFVEQNMAAGTEIDVNGKLMNIEFPLMDKYLEILTDEDGHAYTRDINGNVNLLDNVSKDPFTNQLIRTDNETGEVTQFNPTAILQNVDEGRIDVSIYPSDVVITDDGEILFAGGETAESMASAGWMLDESGDWGYDFEGDGVIDLYEDEIYGKNEEPLATNTVETEETAKTEQELLDEQIEDIADYAGIDEIRKVKVNETEDGFNIKIKGEDGEKIKINETEDSLNIKIKGEDGEKIKMHLSKEGGADAALLEERIQQIADEEGIDDIRKIKVNETEDGWNVKIKGDDGDKVKMHISKEELDNDFVQDDVSDTHSSDDAYEDFTQDDPGHEHQS